MLFGIDRILQDKVLRKPLFGQRVALLAHPASMTKGFKHTIDALVECHELNITAAFGPQHGMRGEKQDNMVETEDYTDPDHGFPVFSLYGKVRRPTPEMLAHFDVLLVDLQDVGCRIYTFLTTLFYMIDACAEHKKEIWVLDRPNPAGRPIEGSLLKAGWESFVGAAPMPMRHGLTLGEAANWYVAHKKLSVNLRVIEMEGYAPTQGPGFGWPLGEYAWVNPSPNAASYSMPRCYPGTVLFEGTLLSEGRGTTRPLEMFGAPDLEVARIIEEMAKIAPDWLNGARIRPCWFEPTFHKHAGKICAGIQLHVDDLSYQHEVFRPYRFVALFYKAIRGLYPNYDLWRTFTYEYEAERLAIDLINGGPGLRQWVDDPNSTAADFEIEIAPDEEDWAAARKPFLLY